MTNQNLLARAVIRKHVTIHCTIVLHENKKKFQCHDITSQFCSTTKKTMINSTYLSDDDDDDVLTEFSSSSTIKSAVIEAEKGMLFESLVRSWTQEKLWSDCKFLDQYVILKSPVDDEDNIFYDLFKYIGCENDTNKDKMDILISYASQIVKVLREKRSNSQMSLKKEILKSK